MINLMKCKATEEELDQIRLGIIKMLFNKELKLISGEFITEPDGTKFIHIQMEPKEVEE